MNPEKPQDSIQGETTRNKKMRFAAEIFNCECGKNYLTFSALYLHVRLKHNQRLTTKKDEVNFKTEEINNKKYTTYFLKQTLNIKQNQNQNQYNNLKTSAQNQINNPSQSQSCIDIINQYHAYLQNQTGVQPLINKKEAFHLLEALISYFKKLEELNIQTNYQQIPLFYNDFLVYYLHRFENNPFIILNIESKTTILQMLYLWLKRMNYTKVQLIILSRQTNKQLPHRNQ